MPHSGSSWDSSLHIAPHRPPGLTLTSWPASATPRAEHQPRTLAVQSPCLSNGPFGSTFIQLLLASGKPLGESLLSWEPVAVLDAHMPLLVFPLPFCLCPLDSLEHSEDPIASPLKEMALSPYLCRDVREHILFVHNELHS